MDALNAITWPAIARLVDVELRARKAAGAQLVLMEAAIMLEAGWDEWVDEVWMVGVPPVRRRCWLRHRCVPERPFPLPPPRVC